MQKKGKGKREHNDRLIVVPSHEERWDDATKLEPRIRNLGMPMSNRDADIE